MKYEYKMVQAAPHIIAQRKIFKLRLPIICKI